MATTSTSRQVLERQLNNLIQIVKQIKDDNSSITDISDFVGNWHASLRLSYTNAERALDSVKREVAPERHIPGRD